MNRNVLFALAALLAASFSFSDSAPAAQTVNFPDVSTPNLVYSSLEEWNNSIISGQSLFAGVSKSGDSLVLQSTAFTTSSVGGIDFLSGNFDTTITAKPGYKITAVSIRENGSATTFGAGTTAYLNMEASVIPSGDSLMMDMRDYTKVGVAGPPSSATWTRIIDFAFNPSGEVLLTLRNDLLVDGTGGVASIGKDKVVIGVRVIAIPEPSSALALAMMGITVTAVRRRRRR